MKILFLSPIATSDVADLFYDAHGLPVGYPGAPLIATLVRELLKRGHEISVVTHDPTIPLNSPCIIARGERFSVWYCPRRPRAFRFNNGLPGRVIDLFRFERMAMESAVNSIQPDVVHAHWLYEFAWVAISSGRPNVITAHDVPRAILSHQPSIYRLTRWIMSLVAVNKSKMITAISPYVAESLAKKGIVVIPNPMPEMPELNTYLDENRKKSVIRIAMVCNGWSPWKNAKAGFLGFKKFRENFPDSELCCFGSDFGPHEYASKWAIRNACQSGVKFYGSLPHRELLDKLRTCSVLIHPSLEESFAMAVAEAMALGLFVIGGKYSGGVPFVVEENGLLVDVRDPYAIAAALVHIMENPEYMKNTAIAGQVATKIRFSVDAVIRAYEEVYVTAVDEHRCISVDG